MSGLFVLSIIFTCIVLFMTVITLLINNKEDRDYREQGLHFGQPIYRFLESQVQCSMDGGNTWKTVAPCISQEDERQPKRHKRSIRIKLGPRKPALNDPGPRGQEIGERVRHRISQGQSVRRRTI